MSEVLDPVRVEQAIRDCSQHIRKGVDVVSNAEAKYKEAQRVYDRAVAYAYLNSEGAAHEKKYRAELATREERDALDVAYLAFRHAERTARALVEELRALQSCGASVRAMYTVAGRGE